MKMMRAMTVLAAAAAVAAMGVTADDDPAYYCDSDAYCEKTYPGTVCISVNNYGDVVSKCTPNTAKRPACRGAQPGLCPSYQAPERGYLNAHCVFVSEDNLDLSTSSSGSSTSSSTKTTSSSSSTASSASAAASTGASTSASASASGSGRRLKEDATSSASASASVGDASTSGSAAATSSSASASSSSSSADAATATSGSGADALLTVTISGTKVTGQFVCLDVSDCQNKAADPSTCSPSTCGSADSLEVCTYQGTCTYKSAAKITKRSCECYAGFEGTKCEKEVSAACDVDCGSGGDCVDSECVCKAGWDGKAYDGKQGKANQRCTKCTNDLACQHDNPCDTSTGKCICGPGYNGDTCGATEDSCTTRTDCSIGACQVLANGSSACFCPLCSPDCQLCDITGNSSFDCSTCPTAAASVQSFNLLLFVSAFVAVVLANFAL
ncbi:hypothetical protein BBJ28_00011866 [Nothophytophthora sp. Chile5]|nr:hypothetical protein BBJ28_00011866 [Nothophytophthora sp. Chile5]